MDMSAIHFSLWRIWMIYYGGISLAVATGLYSVFCPKPVKDHGSGFEPAQSECQYLATMGLGEKYLRDVKQLEAKRSTTERSLTSLAPIDHAMTCLSIRAGLRGRPSSWLRSSFTLGGYTTYAFRWLRPWLLMLYGAGFLLLGIPAAVTLVQVTLAGLRSWFR